MREYHASMSLARIESIIDTLSVAEKQQLMRFLATRLRAQGDPVPTPRVFSTEEIDAWIDEDCAEMARNREDVK
jgi:hypothetical protein